MQTSKIHILHTNDIHSHFEAMPQIAGGIRSLKERFLQDGDQVVVVDLGDHTDRMHFITEGSWGQANIEVMNQTGYEIGAIGNNEGLTFPKEKFKQLYDHAKFHVICSNLYDQDNQQLPDPLKPFYIQLVGGLRLGWVSATAAFRPFYELIGWQVEDPYEKIKTFVEQIREQVDVVIVLSHTGYSNDQKMAAEIPGIDIIIGAHTHHLLKDGENINNTFIIQAGKFGNYLGKTTITYDPSDKRIFDISGICYESEQFTPAQDIIDLIASKTVEADLFLTAPIVTLDHEFTISWYEESPLGNLLAEGVREWVDAEISLVNAGLLLFSLPKGPISAKDLLAVCPHPINPCKLWLQGSDIKQILEESLREANIHREIHGFGFRGKKLGWMCVDGMAISYDKTQAEGSRIRRIEVNGEPISYNQTYSIGTIDMFTFSRLFPSFHKASQIKYFLPEFIRNVLASELLKGPARVSSEKPRWIHV